MKISHELYVAALAAGEAFSDILKQHGLLRTRWTMKAEDWLRPGVREAYKAKLAADEKWLSFLRQDSIQREMKRKENVS